MLLLPLPLLPPLPLPPPLPFPLLRPRRVASARSGRAGRVCVLAWRRGASRGVTGWPARGQPIPCAPPAGLGCTPVLRSALPPCRFWGPAWACSSLGFWPVVGGVLVGVMSLPGMAERLESLVPTSREADWGEALVAPLEAVGVCTGLPGRIALDRLARRLAAPAALPWPMRLHMVRLPLMQPLVLPGGHVVLGEALLRSLRSPDEVAGLLALALAESEARVSSRAVIRTQGARAVLGLMIGHVEARPLGLGVYLRERVADPAARLTMDARALALLGAAGLRERGLTLYVENQNDAAELPFARPPGLAPVLAPLAVPEASPPERLRRLRVAPRGGDVALEPADWTAVRLLCQ